MDRHRINIPVLLEKKSSAFVNKIYDSLGIMANAIGVITKAGATINTKGFNWMAETKLP